MVMLFEGLPEELNLEITKRMTVKSLVRCTSVCRKWYTQIKDPSFILIHLRTALPNPRNTHIVYFETRDKVEVNEPSTYYQLFDGFNRLEHPLKDEWPDFEFVGSCNGLVCIRRGYIANDSIELILWNPSLRKYIVLPKPSSIFLNRKGSQSVGGLGFDPNTLDFKVVVVVTMFDAEKGESVTEANLFSLNANSWNSVTVPATFPKYGLNLNVFPVCGDGVVYWLGYERGSDGEMMEDGLVLRFDIIAEKFLMINLPEALVGESYLIRYKKSSFAVVQSFWENHREMIGAWAYGVDGSWLKVFHMSEIDGIAPSLLQFWKDGELLLEVPGEETVLSSLKNLGSKPMDFPGFGADMEILHVDSYVESLVLLYKVMNTSDSDASNN